MSHVMTKPAFCICKNKNSDLCGYCPGDQCLCFCYIDSTFPLRPKPQAIFRACIYSPVCVGPGKKPRKQVFLRHGSCIDKYLLKSCRLSHINLYTVQSLQMLHRILFIYIFFFSNLLSLDMPMYHLKAFS